MQQNNLKKNRGITIFIVLIVVLVSALMAVWASRSAIFNQLIISNDADYQRAFAAAQATLQDAELDISSFNDWESNCSNTKCRIGKQGFPLEQKDVLNTLIHLESNSPTTGCIDGICTKRVENHDFWSDDGLLTTMKGSAAKFGQYTGIIANAARDPILSEKSWYWIEILPYDESSKYSSIFVNPTTEDGTEIETSKKIPLHLNPNIIYKITAISEGLKPGTRVILQSTVVYKNIDS